MQRKKLLALTMLLCFSLLVILPTVHANSTNKILTIHIRTEFWRIEEEDGVYYYTSYGEAWGDFTGTIYARPTVHKFAGDTWHIVCTEYWWHYDISQEDIDKWWINGDPTYVPTMISGVWGTIDFGTTPASTVFNGQVKNAIEPYVELVGRNVHFEGTFTWDPELVFVIEATLWFMPNK